MISMIQNNILWSPLQIGGLTTKNRFAVLPMECADAAEGGHLSQDMQMRYDRYAEGGAGLVFLEAVTLQHETRSRDRQLLLDVYKKESREEWERFVASFKAKHPNTLLIFQYHPCRRNCRERIFQKSHGQTFDAFWRRTAHSAQ